MADDDLDLRQWVIHSTVSSNNLKVCFQLSCCFAYYYFCFFCFLCRTWREESIPLSITLWVRILWLLCAEYMSESLRFIYLCHHTPAAQAKFVVYPSVWQRCTNCLLLIFLCKFRWSGYIETGKFVLYIYRITAFIMCRLVITIFK